VPRGFSKGFPVRADHNHRPAHQQPFSAAEPETGVGPPGTLAAVVDALAPHVRTLLGGGVALLLAAAGWILISSQSETTRARSWDAYLAAMASAGSGEPADEAFQNVSQRHPGTAAADWSRLRMAEIRIAGGTSVALKDRAAAARDFETAVGILSELLATRPSGLLAEQTTFALAKAREGLGQFDQARKGYETVAREYPQGPTATAARTRSESLANGSATAWYDWLGKQDLSVPPRPTDPTVENPPSPDAGVVTPAPSETVSPPEKPPTVPPGDAGSAEPQP